MRPRSLRARFVLIVVLGAVLPLALVGIWISRSTERAGRTLLVTQLNTAAAAIAARADKQWALRSGELELLANNTVARRVVAGTDLSRDDSLYLDQLTRSLGATIVSFAYVDASGRERWSTAGRSAFEDNADRPSDSDPARSVVGTRALRVEAQIAADGRVIGRLVARVRLASVVSTDSGQVLAPGATITIADARGVIWSSAPDSVDIMASVPNGWAVVHSTPLAAPLQLALAAPVEPYVKPFEQSARGALVILMAVALVALVLSVALTTRMTRSLARLSDAAGAVAAGDLSRSVSEEGDDEVARLATSFNVMTQSLRRTVAELSKQRALAAVGEFAASLSHDVRNSLTAIRVDLQHALRLLPEDNRGAMLGARALDSVRRLDATVTSALHVARGGRASKSPVELGAVLKRAIAGAEPAFVERGAVLEPLREHASVEVAGDAAALEQLFLNLLLNAAEALEIGGRARVEIETTGDSATVRVVDTGHGISVEELESLGAMLTSTKPGGTGLGLPIARRIAAAHGGELRFTSARDVGTTAVVRLPIATEDTRVVPAGP